MNSLASLDVAGKRVFLRCDLNVPLNNGEITDDGRIRASLPTITNLLERGASLVIGAHLGRPKGEAKPELSLQPIAKQTDAKIISTPLADYPYRIAITNEQFSKWVSAQVMAVDYKNFKSEVADTLGYGFAKPLNQVWSAMHDVEDAQARVRN